MLLKIQPEKIVPKFEVLGQFVEEAIITINQEGLETTYPDRAMVCVIGIRIPKSDFEVFEFDKIRKIGLNIKDFLGILKRASGERITFEIGNKNMVITIDTVRKFTVPYLNLSEEEVPSISELAFTSSFKIKSEVFLTAIKDGLTIGDTLVIKTEANTNKINFLTQGDVSKVESEVVGQDLSINGSAQARYPLEEYLKKLKFDTDEIKVEFGQDYPLKISWGSCFFVCAPRVVEDEEKV